MRSNFRGSACSGDSAQRKHGLAFAKPRSYETLLYCQLRTTRPLPADRLLHGRVFRALTLLDECSRYALAVQPEFSYPSASVVCTLEQAAREHGYPRYLRVDNGPEFIASALEVWAHDHNVELLFIQPGKPTQNAFIESFNSRVRDELLMTNRFRTIFEARFAAEDWRNEYNTKHSHSSLGGMTPEEFLARYEITNPPQKSLAA
jgi:putative transposase